MECITFSAKRLGAKAVGRDSHETKMSVPVFIFHFKNQINVLLPLFLYLDIQMICVSLSTNVDLLLIVPFFLQYEGVSRSFRTESITK
jgi:hypothetical protein